LFTGRLDVDRATIRARGRVDHISADLVRRAIETLQLRGHRHITIDVAGLTETEGAVGDLLAGMVAELSPAGIQLVVRHDDPRRRRFVSTAAPSAPFDLVRQDAIPRPRHRDQPSWTVGVDPAPDW